MPVAMDCGGEEDTHRLDRKRNDPPLPELISKPRGVTRQR